MRRLPCPLAAMAALVLACAPAAGAKPVPRVPPDWLGVTVDGPLTSDGPALDGEWDLMKASGVGFVRLAIYWRDFQPRRNVIDLGPTDGVVLEAARRGLPVLPVVLGAPAWARMDRGDPASPPRDPRTYARALQILALRYGPNGSFWKAHPEVVAQPMRDWQVWNEPNLRGYWSKQPFARRYVRMVRITRRALRRVDPGAKVILAGLPNKSWLALRSIYRAGGRGTFDAIALHPYTSQVRYIVSIVRLARHEAIRAHDRRVPIWLTEVSWPAAAAYNHLPSNGFEVTDRGQARRLQQTLVALARVRRRLGIARVVWYTWISAEGHAIPSWAGFAGLRRVRQDGTIVSAPSLAAFTRTAAELRR